jgi:hypothetical protein
MNQVFELERFLDLDEDEDDDDRVITIYLKTWNNGHRWVSLFRPNTYSNEPDVFILCLPEGKVTFSIDDEFYFSIDDEFYCGCTDKEIAVLEWMLSTARSIGGDFESFWDEPVAFISQAPVLEGYQFLVNS